MTLREHVTQILYQADQEHDTALYPNSGMASETLDQSGERDAYEHQADAVLAVVAEHLEALPRHAQGGIYIFTQDVEALIQEMRDA